MFILIFFMISYNGITYNPLVDSIISEVDSVEMMKWIREISGEDSIYFLGDSTLILTRWYDTNDMSKAEDYLLRYFKSLGLESYKQVYWAQRWRWPDRPYPFYWEGRYIDFSVANDSLMYLISSDTLLYCSLNRGYLWDKRDTLPILADGITSPVPETLYIYSNVGELYFSADSGNSFQKRDSLIPSNIQDIHFITGKKGWIISGAGEVGITNDAGESWNIIETGVTLTKDIYFIDSLNGWFCGYFGKIYHSMDGGYNWAQQTSPLFKNLYGIYFMNADTGWICGDDGTVLRTTDGGMNWESIGFTTSKDFREVYFRTFLEGWIGGSNGCLYYTSDGGINWIEVEGATMTIKYISEINNNIYFGGERDFLILIDSNYIDMKSYLPNAVCNIIAVQPGIEQPDTVVIIGGHCDCDSGVDTMPYIRAPGANNNGSGVGAVKEAAKLYKDYNFKYTIEYMLWGSEEMGGYGSRYYVEQALSESKPIKGVIDVNELGYDTVGTYDIYISTDSNSNYCAYLAVDIINIYNLPLNVSRLDTNRVLTAYDIAQFWLNGYRGILFENNDHSPNDLTIYDTVDEINVDFYYNYTKLALAELAYMAGFLGAGIPEDVQAPIALKLNNSIINGSQFSFSVTCSGNIPVKISLYDITGRMINRVFEGRMNGNKQFNVNKAIKAGVYFLRIDSDIGVVSKKIVIL